MLLASIDCIIGPLFKAVHVSVDNDTEMDNIDLNAHDPPVHDTTGCF